jgi:transposase InsO family protein
MIVLEDRQALARDIDVAHAAGARLQPACALAGIELRTLQRWKAHAGLTAGDGRPQAEHPTARHALSPAEREALLAVANEPRFADVPPARIVPMLADEGIYLASESSFGRVLRAHGQNARRGRAKPPKVSRPPTTHLAAAPGEVWCWDMTYLPATVMGRWFYLYLILDLYSRKIVGWEAHETDHADHATHLVRRTALAEGVAAMRTKPVLHGDNGSTLKATTVLAMLNWLGIQPSYSRPRVSDDNAFAESLFRTAKYRPEFPAKGFTDLEADRARAILEAFDGFDVQLAFAQQRHHAAHDRMLANERLQHPLHARLEVERTREGLTDFEERREAARIARGGGRVGSGLGGRHVVSPTFLRRGMRVPTAATQVPKL